jgi:hypothetical protein
MQFKDVILPIMKTSYRVKKKTYHASKQWVEPLKLDVTPVCAPYGRKPFQTVQDVKSD